MNVGESFAADSAIYDRSRRQLVPCFDDFYRSAVEFVDAPPEAPLRVLDLGAGTGLLTSFYAERFPDARFTLVDAAPEMLERAEQRLAGCNGRCEFVSMDFGLLPLPPGPFDAVISCLAIHHLEDAEKRALFTRVHGVLADGGWFVNADEVAGRTPAWSARNHDAWLAGARALVVADSDLAAARKRMEHDRLATLDDQLHWLEAAGFRDVDCSFKNGMFAVFGGRR